jgi:hypothetical protein
VKEARLKIIMLVQTILISIVSTHAILETPLPRTNGNMSYTGTGIKIVNFPPTPAQLNSCLGSTASPKPNTVLAGTNLNVKWAITIPHISDPGVRVAINYPPSLDFAVLKDNIDVNVKNIDVLIPAKLGSATLQWIWASQEDGGFYMACSDLMVTDKAVNATTATKGTPSKSFGVSNVPSVVAFALLALGF